jgi:hypothetical protein
LALRSPQFETPPFRRLRVFAFDPSLALRLQTLDINEITLRVPWDGDPETGKLAKGPIGEYLEVVDVDPSSCVAYPPVDLDDPRLLAQDGFTPSEGNPQFHQQMVYAVAMATIMRFERALGRVALWAPRWEDQWQSPTDQKQNQFVRRLRLYPHALRERNAYYSQERKAILFGYFPVQLKDADNTPGTTVFTCLSYDIVAHEVTHALLDGIHPRFSESTNPDALAFHEAFADIVALLQRFSYPEVLRDQIARTRGRLDTENLLAELAQQFGRATGHRGALRDALGESKDGVWERLKPNPRRYETEMEPHTRGAILVAAIFGAFLLLYGKRTEDLFRIATQGTGILPEGSIHPDLAYRLAQEAATCAETLLLMCIRALDYCPPVNITFGDYLRAIVTAQASIDPDDTLGYRVAVIENFRQWGIYPRGIRSMSPDALIWPSGSEVIARTAHKFRRSRKKNSVGRPPKQAIRRARDESEKDIKKLLGQTYRYRDDTGKRSEVRLRMLDLSSDREQVWKVMSENRRAVWDWFLHKEGKKYAKAFGIILGRAPRTVFRDENGDPSVEVHSVRTALRRDGRGGIITDLVVELTQRRGGYFSEKDQKNAEKQTKLKKVKTRKEVKKLNPVPDFKYRAGCTIVIDTTNYVFRHIIRTHGHVADQDEFEQVRAFLTGDADPSASAFAGLRGSSLRVQQPGLYEPFALLHRGVAED